jgi:hypothetical protein
VSEKLELIDKLNQLKDSSIHALLVLKLAGPLSINAKARVKESSKYKGDMLNVLPQCELP